ncbi:proline-rich receptor-like protein kinase PERK2 [Miscanthus floridulus]|uniref:proline-rich receptor-like protein kinase PERK2 n=1 Tax=Miscanthus floridulus TaxID=154761 RepID=UPI003457BD28
MQAGAAPNPPPPLLVVPSPSPFGEPSPHQPDLLLVAGTDAEAARPPPPPTGPRRRRRGWLPPTSLHPRTPSSPLLCAGASEHAARPPTPPASGPFANVPLHGQPQPRRAYAPSSPPWATSPMMADASDGSLPGSADPTNVGVGAGAPCPPQPEPTPGTTTVATATRAGMPPPTPMTPRPTTVATSGAGTPLWTPSPSTPPTAPGLCATTTTSSCSSIEPDPRDLALEHLRRFPLCPHRHRAPRSHQPWIRSTHLREGARSAVDGLTMMATSPTTTAPQPTWRPLITL